MSSFRIFWVHFVIIMSLEWRQTPINKPIVKVYKMVVFNWTESFLLKSFRMKKTLWITKNNCPFYLLYLHPRPNVATQQIEKQQHNRSLSPPQAIGRCNGCLLLLHQCFVAHRFQKIGAEVPQFTALLLDASTNETVNSVDIIMGITQQPFHSTIASDLVRGDHQRAALVFQQRTKGLLV